MKLKHDEISQLTTRGSITNLELVLVDRSDFQSISMVADAVVLDQLEWIRKHVPEFNELKEFDLYTYEHSCKVARISTMFALYQGYGKNFVEGIALAGLLHDIGKLYIPEPILKKKHNFTDTDRLLVSTHPTLGYTMLQQHELNISKDVLNAILYHHERYDGKGYTFGLMGRDIPLMPTILHIVDIYSAMTEKRVYKRAISSETTIKAMLKDKGCCHPIYLQSFIDFYNEILEEHTPQLPKRKLSIQGLTHFFHKAS